MKAIEAVQGFERAGIISRRPGVGTSDWSHVLADATVDAVAISTENTLHARLAREALEAGKHVLCDYPLAFSLAEAESLLKLAVQKNRILHVEHIGLLASSHTLAAREIVRLGGLNRGEYHFEGDWSGKWSNPDFAGPLPFIAYSRLLQVAEWFGPFAVASSEFRADAHEFFIHLRIHFTAGGTLDFFEVRKPNIDRKRWMEASLDGGLLSWHPQYESEGLFGKDLARFRERVVSNADPYYRNNLMLHCLAVLERIS